MAQKNKIVWYSALLMTITTVILVSKLQLLHVYTLLELQVKFAILFNFKFRDSLSFKALNLGVKRAPTRADGA